jgi:putative peptide zinc metalloprotease protein
MAQVSAADTPVTPATPTASDVARPPLGDALFSGNWYRVSALKPRLRGHVRIHRHLYRGEIWYVVEDRVAGKYHRFNPSSYRVIGLLDGQRTLQAVWDRLTASLDDHTPSQDELVQLFGQLYAADLIQCDVTPDVAELFERGGRQRRSRWLQRFANPVSLRFPLLDPDALLARMLAAAGPLLRTPGLLLWLLAVLPALLIAPSHWRELTGNFNERLLAVDNLLLLAVLFPLLKAAHELGHGLACKRYGGEVHEMGVMLLVFFPVPYVDASSASTFASRWQRMLVGAAGMLTELFIAALAFYLWLALEPGFVRSLAYNVIVLASLTTVMFNANPLLRYDGYYILSDAIESPNLGQRATEYWQYLLRRHVFGLQLTEKPHATPGERRWFVGYAPLAFAYRMFVLFSIALFIASSYFFVGVLIAIWGLMASLVLPLVRGVRRMAGDAALDAQATRVRAVMVGAALVVVLALFGVPVPYHSVAEGVVWPPDSAVLRAQGSGFVSRVVARPGQLMQPGEPVLECLDAGLTARLDDQRARLEQAQARHDAAFGVQPARSALLAEEVRREQAALATLEDEARRLVLRAGSRGALLLAKHDDLPGRYLRRGDVIGHLDTGEAPVVRVVLPQWQIAPMQAAAPPTGGQQGAPALRIQVRLPQDPGSVWPATLNRSVPSAARELPSPALGTAGGGGIALDPRDPKGLQALESMFEHELQLPAGLPYRQIGTRVQVRFEHEAEPLAWRMGRALRRLFLSQFQL